MQLELLFPEYAHLVRDAVDCDLYEGNHLVAQRSLLAKSISAIGSFHS